MEVIWRPIGICEVFITLFIDFFIDMMLLTMGPAANCLVRERSSCFSV